MNSAAQPIRWGTEPAGPLARGIAWLRGVVFGPPARAPEQLPDLPVRLRRMAIAAPYLEAEAASEHSRAGAAAIAAAEAAIVSQDWWVADTWTHRALWHFEQASLALPAIRAARRIGDLRTMAGDPDSARRYYAEAISEARDVGAQREEGLAALGLARAELDRRDVTTARRLASVALDSLEAAGAPSAEIDAARALRGTERSVNETI